MESGEALIGRRQTRGFPGEAAKYFAIFRIELRQLTTYSTDFILSNITVVLFFYVLVQVWKVTVSPQHIAAVPGENFTWDQLLWFLAGGQILWFSVQGDAQLEIEHDVISGNIAVTLSRPYDYLLSRFAVVMANTLLAFAVAFPAGLLVAWISTGSIAITPLGLGAFLIAFVLRTLLYFMLQAIAGLATFWIERATAFVYLTGLLILIFGGGAVPLGYWPHWAQTAVQLTPFPTMMYYPAKLLVQPTPVLMLDMLLHAAVWLGIMGAITALLYRRGIRRLDINGG